MPKYSCPVCNSHSEILDVVDFNKCCEEIRGKFLEKSGVPVYYAMCSSCDFVFAPEFSNWTDDEFLSKIYNDGYIEIDPDYIEARPNYNYDLLLKLFGNSSGEIRHLDYGGGNGKLSEKLSAANWNSTSYDPFPNGSGNLSEIGTFNLITAFEVFEHVPNPSSLMKNLEALIEDEGIIFFSTLINDNNIKKNERLSWWYASPRNGHVSLYSHESLKKLGEHFGFNFASMGIVVHIYYKKFPTWAQSLLDK